MMEKDWIFATDAYICDLRTVAVVIKDNKVLVQREKDGKEYALPGGHVKIGETLEEGLIREMREEMGIEILCRRLIWSEECFWEWNGRKAHGIAFYYLVELAVDLKALPDDVFVPQKDNANVVIGWMPISALKDVVIYPAFLKEEIFHLDEPMKHFVSRD